MSIQDAIGSFISFAIALSLPWIVIAIILIRVFGLKRLKEMGNMTIGELLDLMMRNK